MRRIILAAVRYGGLVFAIGFLLGTMRVLWVAPRLGEMGAVLLELPIMLAASWWIAPGVVRIYAIPPKLRSRVAMGAFAFTVLILLEVTTGRFAFGRSLAEQWWDYQSGPAAMGLVGQLMFATIPAIQVCLEASKRGGRGRD